MKKYFVAVFIAGLSIAILAQNPVSVVQVGTGTPVTTTIPVSGSVTVSDGSGALNVIVDSGSITANAGTNLNTSALALETGGNLDFISSSVDFIAFVTGTYLPTLNNLETYLNASNVGSFAKVEDVGSVNADRGVPAMAVRKNTPANTSVSDSDYEFLQMSNGRLWASTLLTDGTDTAQVTAAGGGSLQVESVASNIVTISFAESVAAPTAAVWYLKRQWALPAGAVAVPQRAWVAVTTAASRSMINVINSLGTLNLSTNAFAAVNSVASPFFYGRLFGCVTTVQSATATTLTVTYTDELGGSSTSGTGVFASASPVGNCYEFALATGDVGVRAVTNVTDTAAPTGIVTVYGMNPIIDSLGPAAVLDSTLIDHGRLNANEQIAFMLMQAATTAQQRSGGVTLSLR